MKEKILILGISGMLGSAIFKESIKSNLPQVYGTLRKKNFLKFYPKKYRKKIILNLDVFNLKNLEKNIRKIKPKIIINCVGMIKQKIKENNVSEAIYLNALFPHQLAGITKSMDLKLIHISTDCVFDGKKGMYKEINSSNANDLYGRSKYLGEIYGKKNLTLRTSIIGHELNSSFGLLNWFLKQQKVTRGFTKAIFSGLPTNEIAKIIFNYVIPNKKLNGLFHISSKPISKYDLLKLTAKIYKKKITIIPDKKLAIDRSLDSSLFRKKTNYKPSSWESLILSMYCDQL